VAKKNDPIWFGFLEAGTKSSPVALDGRLNTANPKTLYLYNHARGDFLEYAREIVEPKLRELKEAEAGLVRELKSGFDEARRTFEPRGRDLRIPEKRAASTGRKAVEEPEENEVYDDFAEEEVEVDGEDVVWSARGDKD